MQTLLADEDVRRLNERFESAHPREIVHWALAESGLERLAVASAFQAEGTCVMHMATEVRPDVPILFLETGFHFAETLAFKEQLTELLALQVLELVGEHTVESQERAFGPRLYERDPERCCDINKVQPMFQALRGLDAWITAFRRDSSPTRATAPILDRYELEPGRWIVKVNPVANWTRKDTWEYLKAHELPHNPLYDLGYASIGCAPCTRLRFTGEPERAGRWAGLSKWECGIHERETAQQDVVSLD
jgi:phosphoadenosine phosphosulfate reductase